MGRRIRRGIEAGKQKYSGSPADALWRRLNSVDFLNQGMIFAGTLLLCALPFIIVMDALDRRSTARGLGQRLGLNRQAAGDVGIYSPPRTPRWRVSPESPGSSWS
jgi:membrane protein